MAVLALAAATVVAVGCGGGDDGPPVALDGTPRYADTSGVVTKVDGKTMTLEGGARYDLSADLLAFSTITGDLVAVRATKDQLVLIGLDGKVAEWVAVVSSVVRPGGGDPVAIYQGKVVRVDDKRRVVFGDGTVLSLARDVKAPPAGLVVVAVVDPSSGEISGFQGHV
jgi:hypothetical protein